MKEKYISKLGFSIFALLALALVLTFPKPANALEIHAPYLGSHKIKPKNAKKKHYVGGDAVLLKSGKKFLLMDTGDKKSWKKLKAYLDTVLSKKKTFDLYISHHHEDHFGNYKNIFKSFKVKNIYMFEEELTRFNIGDKESLPYLFNKAKAKKDSKSKGATIKYLHYAKAGMNSFTFGSARVDIIGAISMHKGESARGNNISLIAKVKEGSKTFLSCGDIQENSGKYTLGDGEEGYLSDKWKESLKADFMKLSHHGIRHIAKDKKMISNSQKIIDYVKPSISFIQTKGNPYTKKNEGEQASNGKTWYQVGEQSRRHARKYGFCYPLGVTEKSNSFVIKCSGKTVELFESHVASGKLIYDKLDGFVGLKLAKSKPHKSAETYTETYYIKNGKKLTNTWKTKTKYGKHDEYSYQYHFNSLGLKDDTRFTDKSGHAIKNKTILIKEDKKYRYYFKIDNNSKNVKETRNKR